MILSQTAKHSTTMDSQGVNVVLYVSVLILLFLQPVESLDCLSCSNVHNTTQCGSMTCQQNEKCFTHINNSASPTFAFGCKHSDQCNAQILAQTHPPSIIGRDLPQNDCQICCSSDLCNRDTTSCNVKSQVTLPPCLDDADYNCAMFGAQFDICSNKEHASKICRHYCHLCDYSDGNWSPWSVWSTCDVTCDTGHRTRDRTCTNPAPAHGGKDCVGQPRDTSTCTLEKCPVHGGWTVWSSWSACSVTCGVGLMSKDRSCSSPVPGPNGHHCDGSPTAYSTCSQHGCVVHGGWTGWSSWDACSVTCGVGLMGKDRSCSSPVPGPNGHPCEGSATTYAICSQNGCVDGKWSTWTSWSSCTATCNGGVKSRGRDCNNPAPSMNGRYCHGDNKDTVSCNTKSCSDKPIVYFDVHTPGSIVGGRAVFTSALYNVGAAYSTYTGKFTCTIRGLYMFSVHFTMNGHTSGNYPSCYIRKNSYNIFRAITDISNRPTHDSGSATVFLKLNVGDYVDVGGCVNFESLYHDYDFNFVGALITPS